MSKLQAMKIQMARETLADLETVNAPAHNRESQRKIVTRLLRQIRH